MKRHQNKNLSQGFTLIELLVVISVISLIASIAFTSLASARAKAQDTKRVQDVKQIVSALELYYASNNAYPVSSGWTTAIPSLVPSYMGSLPTPPTPATSNCTTMKNSYMYYSDGTTYAVQFCIGTTVGSYGPGFYINTGNSVSKTYDINQDGVIDSNDVNAIMNFLSGTTTWCPVDRCDVTRNGSVSAADASTVNTNIGQ